MLELGDTDISDAGLNRLRTLKSLKYIYLYGTNVTEKGKNQFGEHTAEMWCLFG